MTNKANGKNPVFPPKPKRSVELTPSELLALTEYRERFSTEVSAAMSIGVDRMVLSRVMAYGSGSQETVTKIRKALKKAGKTQNAAA